MAVRFRNFSKIISENCMELLCTEDEFTRTRIIQFKCGNNHISELEENSFRNKTAPKKLENALSLCGKCNIYLSVLKKVQDRAESLGFTILRLEEDNLTCTYLCSCGAENKSDVKSICRSSRTNKCPKCQNDNNKNTFEIVRKAFENSGCELLSSPSEYVNNRSILRYRCQCGAEAEKCFHEITRGRLCINCKVDRAKQTSVERFGTDNPSKSDIIKKKIVDTNIERHGVPYAMQHPAFFRKAQQSSYQRRLYKSPFGHQYTILGYEDLYLDEIFEKYGDITVYAGEDERIPVINYCLNDGVGRKYYPDIFIPSENKIIEIKRIYRFEQEKESVLAKAQATSMKFNFEIVVYKNRKSKEKVIQCGYQGLLDFCSNDNS